MEEWEGGSREDVESLFHKGRRSNENQRISMDESLDQRKNSQQ